MGSCFIKKLNRIPVVFTLQGRQRVVTIDKETRDNAKELKGQ